MQTNISQDLQQGALAAQAQPFLAYLEEWIARLPASSASEVIAQPDRTALISVDLINGFCYQGPLSSPRVAGIVEPIARLFSLAWGKGVRRFALTQDTHEPEAVEFGQWPAHCVRGTAEAEAVDALKALPFFQQIAVFEKNSIHSGLHTGLDAWLREKPEADTFIIVGDCTDLCVYQLAMHLRLDANARQLQRRVILPADCVQTYDMPVETARSLGILPHPGDLMHGLFLYHMALNGVEVLREIY